MAHLLAGHVGLLACAAYTAALGTLALLRLAGHKSKAFQAAAHLVVGAQFGAYIAGAHPGATLYPALALSTLELFCFLRDRDLL